ncbi:hypothetical protein HQ865_14105 [Mucilaginibacter mali]|uniref:Uncharacterized protein n=1 Tax=Mucilaginibacter mali TaxID=2740462 RepID=A0A7D4TNC7_9SPHI|nr:hypothetical protein [Mucilaginibacter mali]QKJ30833.1 hypothetical protein HQ865_14105 [Mucilaginibacter mali]
MYDIAPVFIDRETGMEWPIVAAVMIIIFGPWFYRKAQYDWPPVNSKQKKRFAIAITFCIALGGAIIYNSVREIMQDQIFKKNAMVTNGITTRFIKQTKSAPLIEYTFEVAGRRYINTDVSLRLGIEPKVPGGVYKVIYNKLDPQMSVMDMSARVYEDQ